MEDLAADAAAARGHRRDRALARTIVSSAGVQGVQIAATLVTLPIAARALTASEFGVLVVLTGVTSLFGFADLGIGFALTTQVAAARARADVRALQEAIGTGMGMTAASGLVLLVAGTVSAWLLPWRTI